MLIGSELQKIDLPSNCWLNTCDFSSVYYFLSCYGSIILSKNFTIKPNITGWVSHDDELIIHNLTISAGCF